MKILLTSEAFTPMVSGVTVSIETLMQQLGRLGHEVRLVTLSSDATSRRVGSVYYARSFNLYVYPGIRGSIAYNHRILNDIIEWGPDIVHSQTEFFTFSYAKKVANTLGLRMVHTYHTLYEDYTGYVMANKYIGKKSVEVFTRERLRNVDVLIAPTEKVKTVLRGYDVHNDIRIIPTGIDLGRFNIQMTDAEKSMLRTSLGIPQGCSMIFTVGRLGAEKNFDETIDLFTALLRRYPDVRLVIAGDGPYKPELVQHVEQNGIAGSVIFAGMVPPANIPRYYRTADLYVNASTSETQGLTYFEALASGTPILCRLDPCITSIIREGENGYVYTDEESYLAAALDMLGDNQRRAAFSRGALQTAGQFSAERFGERVEALYREIISRRD